VILPIIDRVQRADDNGVHTDPPSGVVMVKLCIGATIATAVFIFSFAIVTAMATASTVVGY